MQASGIISMLLPAILFIFSFFSVARQDATSCEPGGRGKKENINNYGGPSENRTRTPVRALDFESSASTSSAKGPCMLCAMAKLIIDWRLCQFRIKVS